MPRTLVPVYLTPCWCDVLLDDFAEIVMRIITKAGTTIVERQTAISDVPLGIVV